MFPRLTGYLLLIMMLVFPAVPELLKIKAGIFALLLICVFVKWLFTGRITLDRRIFFAVIFFCAIGLAWASKGAATSSAGAQKQAQLYALWPMIYVLLAGGVASAKSLVGLNRALVVGAVMLGVTGVGFILSQLQIIPEYWFLNPFASQDQIVTFGEGLLESRIAGLTSVAYLIPFLLASVLMYSRDSSGVSKIWLWIAFALLVALVLTSGKRALLIILGISPVIVLLLRKFLPGEYRLRYKHYFLRALIGVSLVLLGLYLYLAVYHNFSHISLFSMIAEGFAFTKASSAFSRYQQFWALLDGWIEQPFLGAGHGTSVSYIRSETMPWAYELFYLALLFQTGLVGFLFYAAGIVWTYWMGIRIIRQGGLLGHMALTNLSGMTGVLVANGTNPYLVRFDGLWAIFISIAIVNYWLLRSSSQPLCLHHKDMEK